LITQQSTLISPYGGRLVDLVAPDEAAADLKAYAGRLPSIQVPARAAADLESLASGVFSPLDRFMGRADFQRVLEEMRLADGTLFPLPVTLPVEAGPELRLDQDVTLRGSENELLGVLTIAEIYAWDREAYARILVGAGGGRHALAAELRRWGGRNLSGRLQLFRRPGRFGFRALRLAPAQARARLASLGCQDVAAYHPLPDYDEDFLEGLAQEFPGALLLQVADGPGGRVDYDQYTRVRIYEAIVERCLPSGRALLNLAPASGWPPGPRETLWQALVSRNYGANHLVVRQGAGWSQVDSALVEQGSRELGVRLLHAPGPTRTNGRSMPGRRIRREVDAILDAAFLNGAYPPRHRQGVCVWLTGLSGSGKSTTAEILAWLLLERGRQATVLDGDVVRAHLSQGLGFSKADRDTNVRRIGFVAAELVRAGAVVVCAVVSPYRAARADVRAMHGPGQFVEVFVDTPLSVCEARDVKGMYARARRGELQGFTGIDDPYEPPERPEITLDAVRRSPQENAALVVETLASQGFLRSAGLPKLT
jgi:sulfate adenylyltransferase